MFFEKDNDGKLGRREEGGIGRRKKGALSKIRN